MTMTTIAEKRAEWEARNGRPMTIYRAHPLIGRGSVIHDWILHAEVEKRFKKALRIPFFTRVKWFLEGKFLRG